MKKVLGFTDEITVCGCCGKQNLKGTYALEIDGVMNHYGSTCAFKSHGISTATLNRAATRANLTGRAITLISI